MVGDRGFCSTTSWVTWCCNQNCWQLLSFCPENSQTKQPSKIVRQHCPQDTNVHSTQNSKRFKLQYIISRVSLCDSSTRFNLLFMCSLLCGSVAVAGLSASRYEPESLRTWTNRANSEEQAAFLSAIAALPEARVRRIGCLLTWCASMCPGSGTLGQVHFMCCRIQNTTFTQKIWRCSSQVLQAL